MTFNWFELSLIILLFWFAGFATGYLLIKSLFALLKEMSMKNDRDDRGALIVLLVGIGIGCLFWYGVIKYFNFLVGD